MTKQSHTYTGEDSPRLDVAISDWLKISRSQAQKMIRGGRVSVNGTLHEKGSHKMQAGDIIDVSDEERLQAPDVQAEPADFSIYDRVQVLLETDEYLVIHKPAGLLVHTTFANEPVTLGDWVFKTYPKLKGVGEYGNRPGIVHRLDKDASGAMVIAKTQEMFMHLKQQFKDRTVDKQYSVLVHGKIDKVHDTIDFPIDRGKDGRMVSRPKTDPLKLKNVGQVQEGKEARTDFTVVQQFINFTLLDVKIHTGRTHQIRVHMLAYGHPVVGDPLYFRRKEKKDIDESLGRLYLHARDLAFTDLQGERIEAHAPVPQQLEDFLKNVT